MPVFPAEWAPQSAIQLTFPHPQSDWSDCLEQASACFVDIAMAASRFEKVVIVCDDIERVRAFFPQDITANILFVEVESNDTWARDHGGITVFENDKPVILNFVFNGWGMKFAAHLDNLITEKLHHKGILKGEIRHGGLALEGGSIESDGKGILLTTAECLLSPNRNPHLSKAQIEAHLSAVFGTQKFLWLENGWLAGDDTDSHIDTLARLCPNDTIVYVRCDQPDDEHYEALQSMERELQTFTTIEGKPFHLVPLPWPDACYAEDGRRLPATYANFTIINGAVLAPVYGKPQDMEALNTLATVFPDREIIGIDCRILIEQHGSLHCVTMQYPVGVV